MNYILFICTGNYYRSRYAEILFNHLAIINNYQWKAFSRGISIHNPDNTGPISPNALNYLKGKDIVQPALFRFPKSLMEKDLRMARLIVAMKESEHRQYLEKNFLEYNEKTIYWNIHDIDCQMPEMALNELTNKVKRIMHDINHPMSMKTR